MPAPSRPRIANRPRSRKARFTPRPLLDWKPVPLPNVAEPGWEAKGWFGSFQIQPPGSPGGEYWLNWVNTRKLAVKHATRPVTIIEDPENRWGGGPATLERAFALARAYLREHLARFAP